MPTKSSLKLSTIGYAIVYVKDIAKSVPFYRDVLGVRVKVEGTGWAEFDTGATTLALHAEEEGKTHDARSGSTMLVFPVESIDDAHEVLKSNGVKIVKAPHQVCETPTGIGYSIDFEDPDGNLLSLYTEKKK